MKKIHFCLPMIAFIFGLVAPAQLAAQNRTGPRSQRQVLFDFRVERTSAPARIPLATRRSVLSKVFPKYLTDERRCDPQFDMSSGSDPLQAARKAGQIVPSIVDTTTGRFTSPDEVQAAYVISVSECNASHADNFGTKRIAIFSGQKLVADLDVEFRSSIVRKTDLNGDGVDELLMSGGDVHQGTVIEMAALLDFPGGRLRVIEDLGTVVEDSCASGFEGSSSRASVIYISAAAPGKMPRLRMDNYEASCRRTKRWRFISSGKMQ